MHFPYILLRLYALHTMYTSALNIHTLYIYTYYYIHISLTPPEITAFTLPANHYARLLLLTDGITDVITNDKIQQLISHITNTNEASKILTLYARNIRQNKGMKMDDITCIVIDLNPNYFRVSAPLFDMTGGCCTLS